MTAIYSVFKNPVEGKNGGKLHARLVNQTTIRTGFIIEEVSEMSSFSSADVKGMLEALRNRLEFHLKNGESVELEGLGTFSVSLKCPPSVTEKEITPGKVSFHKVNFRCAKALRSKLQSMKMERSTDGSRLKGFSSDKRKQHILAYLEREGTISTYICRSINGCSKYLALKDLKELIDEGKIIRLGKKENSQYGLAL